MTDLSSGRLVGRHSGKHAIELEGSPPALLVLAQALKRAPASLDVTDTSGGEPRPYDAFLTTVLTDVSGGKIRISRAGHVLSIAGSAERLALFAANIESLAGGGLGNHIHVEYHTDHFYLDPSSEALIITLKDA